jgi:6-pyruvoyl-tetrahydropterin synthase
MKIIRKYKFHAAHRNMGLSGKCSRLHGHRYEVEVVLDLTWTVCGITMEFQHIDAQLNPIFNSLDHYTLLESSDPISDLLGSTHVIRFPFPTSVEMLALYLFRECAEIMGNSVFELRLKETESGTVIVNHSDMKGFPKK